MENTEQITIITTLRVDSSERQRNMDAVLRYLQPTGIRVLVLEADRENLYTTWKDFENVDSPNVSAIWTLCSVIYSLQVSGCLFWKQTGRIFIRHGKTLRMLISVLCMTKTLSFIVHII
jgi:hypothetical protein